jgi:hypothetical protein
MIYAFRVEAGQRCMCCWGKKRKNVARLEALEQAGKCRKAGKLGHGTGEKEKATTEIVLGAIFES